MHKPMCQSPLQQTLPPSHLSLLLMLVSVLFVSLFLCSFSVCNARCPVTHTCSLAHTPLRALTHTRHTQHTHTQMSLLQREGLWSCMTSGVLSTEAAALGLKLCLILIGLCAGESAESYSKPSKSIPLLLPCGAFMTQLLPTLCCHPHSK